MNKVQLSKIGEVKKGQTITKKTITEGDIPVIAGGQQPAYYHNEPNRKGDVITVSGSGAYAGFVNFFTEPVFASDCTTIQSLDESKVLTKYVFYILKGQQEYIYSLQRGAGQPHVYPKDLVGIEIPLLPLPIQKQIVSILEKTENLKQKREETNKDTQKIIQSLFYEMFGDPVKNEKGWDVKKIKDCCSTSSGGTPSRAKKEYWGGNIPWIKSGAMNLKEINGAEEFITDAGLKNSSAKYFERDTIVMAMYGATAGKTSILRIRATTNQAVCSIVPERYLHNDFLLFALRIMEKYFVGKAHGGGQPNISQNIVKDTQVIIPPLPLQQEFAKKVQLIESIQSKQQSSTEEINTLFDALLQKAFKGELVK